MLLVVCAHDAVGSKQWFVVHGETNHREVSVGESKRHVASGRETEQSIGPVVNGEDFFLMHGAHDE